MYIDEVELNSDVVLISVEEYSACCFNEHVNVIGLPSQSTAL